MKKGIASSVKPVVEAYIRCGSIVSSDMFPRPTKNRIAVSPMATAMGTFRMMNTSRTVKMSNVSISGPLNAPRSSWLPSSERGNITGEGG